MQGTIPEDAEIPESTLEAWEPFWSWVLSFCKMLEFSTNSCCRLWTVAYKLPSTGPSACATPYEIREEGDMPVSRTSEN